MGTPLIQQNKFVVGFSLIGLIVSLVVFFSTEQYQEYRHDFLVSNESFEVFKQKMKRTYLEDIGRKIYYDPYIDPTQNQNRNGQSFQIQHFFTGESQLLEDLKIYFHHNGLSKEYEKAELRYSRFDGSGRLAQRTIGIFLIFILLGIILQRLSSCKKEKNEENAK